MVRIGAVAVIWFAAGMAAVAQSGPFAGLAANLSEAGTRGKGVFLQRCSICHLPQLPGRTPPMGPVLSAVLRDAKPEREAAIRTLILEGSPQMPGFRYTLAAQDVDGLIVFLKGL